SNALVVVAAASATSPTYVGQMGILLDATGAVVVRSSSAVGTVTNIATTAPIAGGTITTTGTLTCNVASASQAGCLSAAEWNTYNNKGSGTVTGSSTTGLIHKFASAN